MTAGQSNGITGINGLNDEEFLKHVEDYVQEIIKSALEQYQSLDGAERFGASLNGRVEEDGLACKSGAHSEIVTSESQELRHNVNTYVGDIIDDAIDTVKADSDDENADETDGLSGKCKRRKKRKRNWFLDLFSCCVRGKRKKSYELVT